MKYLVLPLFLSLFSLNPSYAQQPYFQNQLTAIAEKIRDKNYKDAGIMLADLEKNYPRQLTAIADYHHFKGRVLNAQEEFQESNHHYFTAKNLIAPGSRQQLVAAINGKIAVNMLQLNRYSEAEKYINQAIAYYKNNEADIDYAETRSDLATIYLNTGDYLKSAEIYMDNVRFYDKSGTVAQRGRAYAQLGLAYDYAGLNEKAEHYYVEAIKLRELARDTVGLMNTYNNLGVVSKNQSQFQKALQYYNRSYDLATRSKRETYKINPLTNMGVTARHIGHKNDAIRYYNEALELARKYKRVSQAATISNNLSVLYNELKDFEKSYPLAKEAMLFAEEQGTLEDKVEYWENYSMALNGLKNNGEAYEALKKSRLYSDSLYRTENTKSMLDLSTKYETERKEQQINLLNARNKVQLLEIENQGLEISRNGLELNNKNLLIRQKEDDITRKSLETSRQKQQITALHQQGTIQQLELERRNIYLVIAAILFAFFATTAYLFYNRRKLQEQARLQAEISHQQGLAARAIIDAEEQERRRIAGDLHDGVGQLLSTALMNLNGLFDRMQYQDDQEKTRAGNALSLVNESYDEMRAISHQMMPNALIHSGLAIALQEFVKKIDPEKLRIDLEVFGLDDRLDDQTENIVYRVIQESVSNVIKHARASRLSIQVDKDEDGLSVTMEDNGRGFDTATLQEAKGIGMKNIFSRIDYLKGTVDIDSRPGKGTLIAIHVPV